MSSNFDPVDAYFSRSSAINEERDSFGVYLTPKSAITELRDRNQFSNSKMDRNERSDTISIDYASISENDDGYGVYLTNVKTKTDDNPVKITGRSKNRPIIQDVYDEDHYCLARNSGFFTDEWKNSKKQDNVSGINSSQPKKSTCMVTCTRNRVLIAILIIIILSLGGSVTYLVLQGTLSFPFLVIMSLY